MVTRTALKPLTLLLSRYTQGFMINIDLQLKDKVALFGQSIAPDV